jgi:NTE family protein
MAAADTAIDASVRASFTAFEATAAQWERAIVRWRCGLPEAERKRLGAGPNWKCGNVRIRVDRVGFDQLEDARAAQLNAIPTRFKLPPEQVDMLIAAGADALRANPTYRAFLAEIGGRTAVVARR